MSDKHRSYEKSAGILGCCWYASKKKNTSLNYIIFQILGIVPPEIVDNGTSHDMVVDEGQNVTFTCSAVGLPEPTIEWRREGKKPLTSFGNDESECWFQSLLDYVIISYMNFYSMLSFHYKRLKTDASTG